MCVCVYVQLYVLDVDKSYANCSCSYTAITIYIKSPYMVKSFPLKKSSVACTLYVADDKEHVERSKKINSLTLTTVGKSRIDPKMVTLMSVLIRK